MNFDGSKRLEGAGAGVILISPQGDKLKYVLRMTFPNASNNEAEYEALIHGMKMAKACGATRLKIFGDSQLVAQQVMNQCDAVNDSMIAYKEVYNELEKLFDGCEVNHISRLSNDEADVLANIGSQCLAIPPGVFWEEISERSTKPKKQQKKEKEEKPSGAKEIPSGEEHEPERHIEIEHNSPRVAEYEEEASRQALEDDVDALDEARDEVLSRVTKYQQDLKNYHSRRLRPRSFQVGDLVLWLTQKSHEKLESPWLGPYIVTEVIEGGSYRIKDKKIGVAEPNPWNVAQLRRFYA
ncbi:hypothetical protein QYE76_063428 [Lolium multiflorum]|uniref:RNase H type-1 domain-containing protein n=1 Tax=Lolium multiflorum TaxID=4521 RepID=A0AAD8S5P2_LOLMU|nr:hypothetical protein QYE76_063428 [Lolium multiflorum]